MQLKWSRLQAIQPSFFHTPHVLHHGGLGHIQCLLPMLELLQILRNAVQADVLKHLVPSLKELSTLAPSAPHKHLYSFVGRVSILQPAADAHFVQVSGGGGLSCTPWLCVRPYRALACCGVVGVQLTQHQSVGAS